MRVGTPVLVAWHRACAGGVSRVSRVLHFVFTLGRGQSSACLEMDIEAWLAASYTETDETVVSLPDVVKEVLKKAFDDSVLDEKQDILDDTQELPPKRMKALVETYQVAYKDVVDAKQLKQIHLVRIDRWLRARFSGEEDEASIIQDAKDKGKPSEAEEADLMAQGLSMPRQMRVLELSMYLGRPVGDSELDGGSYKSPPAQFKGATLAKKGGDLVTLDMVVKKTLDDGQREPLEDWFSELLQLLKEDTTEDTKQVSDRISEFWNKIRRDYRSPKMMARYLTAYRRRYCGRGLPVLSDEDLRQNLVTSLLAEKEKKEEAPPVPTAPASLSSLSSYAGSSTGSSIASSAAAAANESNAKMLAILDKVLAGQSEMKEVQIKLNQKVLAIERTVNAVSGDRCFLCNEIGHKKENCPNKERFTRSGKLKADASSDS